MSDLQEVEDIMNEELADLTFFLIGFFRTSQQVFSHRRELDTHIAFEKREFDKLIAVMDIPNEETITVLEEYVVDILMSP